MRCLPWANAAAAFVILITVPACLQPPPSADNDAGAAAPTSPPDAAANPIPGAGDSGLDAAAEADTNVTEPSTGDADTFEAAPDVVPSEPDAAVDGAMDTDPACVPNCTDKDCGDDGCGGTCGSCLPGEFCTSEATCEIGECIPDCDGKTCGSDGCQGSCGVCAAGETCLQSTCAVVPAGCPVPVITALEGSEVMPQTVLHLDGSNSYGNGPISQYTWSVQAPSGSASVFLPSSAAPHPSFEVNISGTYVFTLEVRDSQFPQAQGCPPAQFMVNVISPEAIHVELIWHTPGDPDQTDTGPEAGADLDLHFAHPFANSTVDVDEDGLNEPWFHSFYDCFWFNGNPNWGNFDPLFDDDPGLDRDDTDGAGPENMNLNIPEDGATYSVGVHYWNDHGWGPSYASVRIYLDGALAAKYEHVLLEPHDLWEVATIEWPSGLITPMGPPGQQPHVMPSYPNPIFPAQ